MLQIRTRSELTDANGSNPGFSGAGRPKNHPQTFRYGDPATENKGSTLGFSLAVTGAAIQFRRRYVFVVSSRDCVFCKNVLQ